jgi:glycosyltransferase involved in cell wall biosynthesis
MCTDSTRGSMAVAVRELSALFPAFDEQENVEATVADARDVLAARGLDRYEVIVIDDGSTDSTVAIADRLAEAHPEVRVVHHPMNKGYGAALRSGFAAARYEWVFLTDADGQFAPAEIDRLLTRTDEYDVVIGFREQRADHLGRKVNTFLWTSLVRVVFRLKVRDVDCAFKLIRRSALEKIGPLESSGAVISTELLVKLRHAGIDYVEVGVVHYPRTAGQPTGANLRVIARAFRELFGLRRSLRKGGGTGVQ